MNISCESDSTLRSFLVRTSLEDVSFVDENAILLKWKDYEENDTDIYSALEPVT